eukprot:g7501.t1
MLAVKWARNSLVEPDNSHVDPAPAAVSARAAKAHDTYCEKLGLRTNGVPSAPATPRPPLRRTLASGVLAFTGILVAAAIHHDTELNAIIGSFGASAVLLYDAIDSPLAQPRNVIGGQVVSALVGVGTYKAMGVSHPWLACATAVALAIMAMDVTRTLHPPGGATALIAVLGPEPIHALGFRYALEPVLLGSAILTSVAVLGNNLFGDRRYPKRYW